MVNPTYLTPAFGARGSSSYGWEVLYCGYRYEAATGVYHVRHRIYLTPLGCWGQRDFIKYNGEFNLLQYVASRSTHFVDGWGLQAEPCSKNTCEDCVKGALKNDPILKKLETIGNDNGLNAIYDKGCKLDIKCED